MVGFAAFGPSRDDDAPPGMGEIPAIYLAPDVVGTGVGRDLFAGRTPPSGRRVRRATSGSEANERARRFYERAGWTWDGSTSSHDFDCANEPSCGTRWT